MERFHTNSLSVPEHKVCQMPRKEYKTITVKAETHAKFLRAVRDAKRDDATDNSKFLDLLLNTHKRSKNR